MNRFTINKYGFGIACPVLRLACVTLILSSVGCKTGMVGGNESWDVRQAFGMASPKEPEPQLPTRLASSWTETVLTKPGSPPTRGFGGRLLFFKGTSEEPVRVDGRLVVYAFDETDREAYQTEPDRRYIFPRDQFARHESESDLGPSYSVWIPWDKQGNTTKKVSLIVRFEPHKGPIVIGEQTNHLLPGADLPIEAAPGQPSSQVGAVTLAQHTQIPGEQSTEVQQASAESNIEDPRSGYTSTTITLPKKWKQRLSLPAAVEKKDAP